MLRYILLFFIGLRQNGLRDSRWARTCMQCKFQRSWEPSRSIVTLILEQWTWSPLNYRGGVLWVDLVTQRSRALQQLLDYWQQNQSPSTNVFLGSGQVASSPCVPFITGIYHWKVTALERRAPWSAFTWNPGTWRALGSCRSSLELYTSLTCLRVSFFFLKKVKVPIIVGKDDNLINMHDKSGGWCFMHF